MVATRNRKTSKELSEDPLPMAQDPSMMAPSADLFDALEPPVLPSEATSTVASKKSVETLEPPVLPSEATPTASQVSPSVASKKSVEDLELRVIGGDKRGDVMLKMDVDDEVAKPAAVPSSERKSSAYAPKKQKSPKKRESNGKPGGKLGRKFSAARNKEPSVSRPLIPALDSRAPLPGRGAHKVLSRPQGGRFSSSGTGVAVASRPVAASPFSGLVKSGKSGRAVGLHSLGITGINPPINHNLRRTGILQFAKIGGPKAAVVTKLMPNGHYPERILRQAIEKEEEWAVKLLFTKQHIFWAKDNEPVRNQKGYQVRLFVIYVDVLPPASSLLKLGEHICEMLNNSPDNSTTTTVDAQNLFFVSQPNGVCVWSDIVGERPAYDMLLSNAGEPAGPGFFNRHRDLVFSHFRHGNLDPHLATLLDAPVGEVRESMQAQYAEMNNLNLLPEAGDLELEQAAAEVVVKVEDPSQVETGVEAEEGEVEEEPDRGAEAMEEDSDEEREFHDADDGEVDEVDLQDSDEDD